MTRSNGRIGRDLNVREVAGRLGVTAGTIRRYIKAGTLSAYKLPFDPQSKASQQRAEWRIPESEVERIRQAEPTAPVYDRARYMRALRG